MTGQDKHACVVIARSICRAALGGTVDIERNEYAALSISLLFDVVTEAQT